MTESTPVNLAPRLLKGRLLRGANIHQPMSVFSQRFAPGRLAGLRVADAGEGFAARFVLRFGGLDCSAPDGCLPESARAALASEPGPLLSKVLLEAILAVERFAASALCHLDPPGFSRVISADGLDELVWESRAAWISRAAARAGFAGMIELLPAGLAGEEAPKPDFATLIARLRRVSRRRFWSPATALLAQEARRRGLPHQVLAGSYVRIGEGAVQQMISESVIRSNVQCPTPNIQSPGEDPIPSFQGPTSPGHSAVGHWTLDIQSLFPAGLPESIPVALVIGGRGTRAAARGLERLLRMSHEGVGLATRRETTIQGRPVDSMSLGRHNGAAFLLGDPRVRTVISAVSPRHVVENGLRLARATATAVLSPKRGADPAVFQAGVEATLRVTTGAVVIGTGNPFLEQVLGVVDPARVILVTRRARHPVAMRHAASGGVVVLGGNRGGKTSIDFRRGGSVIMSLPVALPPDDGSKRSRQRLVRALFTAGLAFGLGVRAPYAGKVPVAIALRPRTMSNVQ